MAHLSQLFQLGKVKQRPLLFSQYSCLTPIPIFLYEYFRLVARLEADGVDLSALLIEKGLAVPYDGRTKIKDWCAEEDSSNP